MTDDLTKHDISSEEWREYVYHDYAAGRGYTFRIDKPVTLYVKSKPSGDSHRVVNAEGVTTYVKPGWTAIRWKADPEVEF